MESKESGAVAVILLIDVALVFIGVFGAKWFGSRIVSFSTASIGIVTFLGLFAALFSPGLLIERTMRHAIAGSMIAMYLSIVGMTTFFPEAAADNRQTLGVLPNTMIESFKTVISVVIGFYFTSSAVVEGIQRFKTGQAKDE